VVLRVGDGLAVVVVRFEYVGSELKYLDTMDYMFVCFAFLDILAI
jgi:hypothetical protein